MTNLFNHTKFHFFYLVDWRDYFYRYIIVRLISQLMQKKTSERDIRNSRQILHLLLVIMTHQCCSACWSSNAIWKHLQIVDIRDHVALLHESATRKRTFMLALQVPFIAFLKTTCKKTALEQNCEISYLALPLLQTMQSALESSSLLYSTATNQKTQDI